jgi:hypothetical protein
MPEGNRRSRPDRKPSHFRGRLWRKTIFHPHVEKHLKANGQNSTGMDFSKERYYNFADKSNPEIDGDRRSEDFFIKRAGSEMALFDFLPYLLGCTRCDKTFRLLLFYLKYPGLKKC